jgi:DNA-binding protein Fis
MGLEEIIFANVEIRNFLKMFSEHQWNKVCKATLMLGIHRLQEIV